MGYLMALLFFLMANQAIYFLMSISLFVGVFTHVGLQILVKTETLRKEAGAF